MGAYVNGVYVPALAEVDWDDEINDFLTRAGSRDIDVTLAPYGADPTGSADSTAAIQAALDDATGAGVATSVARIGATVILPPGTYKISSPLVVHSVRGMRILGAGVLATRIIAAATMSQVFELDGFSLGELSDLMISGDSTHNVTRGVYLHWNPSTAAGSTYGNVFKQVYIEGGTLGCDIGWACGTDSTTDVSRNKWITCQSTGGQASASTGGTWNDARWQQGWKFGNGSAGNVLDNTLIGCTSDHWVHGLEPAGANLSVYGGEIMHNAVDFYHTGGVAGPLVVSGIRSEWSERLYDSVVNGNPNSIILQGIIWKTDHMPANNFVIRYQGGGSMIVDGCMFMAGVRPSSSTPKIQTGSSRSSNLQVRGVSVDNTPVASFVDNTNNPPAAFWSIENYSQIDGTTGLQTATTIKTDPNAYAHASLPAASGYTARTEFYCTTDKKPVWSDGSAHWVDAAGANHT